MRCAMMERGWILIYIKGNGVSAGRINNCVTQIARRELCNASTSMCWGVYKKKGGRRGGGKRGGVYVYTMWIFAYDLVAQLVNHHEEAVVVVGL